MRQIYFVGSLLLLLTRFCASSSPFSPSHLPSPPPSPRFQHSQSPFTSPSLSLGLSLRAANCNSMQRPHSLSQQQIWIAKTVCTANCKNKLRQTRQSSAYATSWLNLRHTQVLIRCLHSLFLPSTPLLICVSLSLHTFKYYSLSKSTYIYDHIWDNKKKIKKKK